MNLPSDFTGSDEEMTADGWHSSLSVSIIIPAFNSAATIGATLDSVIQQTHSSWEAIVVDDGSTDETSQLVESYIKLDGRIRLVHQPNGGEAAARNGGLPEAQYDWILFLDSDDWIAPEHLAHMTAELLANPELDAVVCRSARVAPDGTQILEKYLVPTGDLFPVLAKRAAFNVHACVFKRSLIENTGQLDTSIKRLPDWDFWQRIARTGANFGAVREVLAFYRMRPGSASLDAVQLLRDGLRILKQGHAPDPRVKKPHPLHINGLPPDGLQSEQYYFLCWCAGLVLGKGEDARPLLETLGNENFPKLWPDAIAQCIFESAPLSQCLPPHQWERLASEILSNIDEFLIALEKQSTTKDLAWHAGNALRKLILQHSTSWKPAIDEYEQDIREETAAHLNLENERLRLEVRIAELERRCSVLQKITEEHIRERDHIHALLSDKTEEVLAQKQLTEQWHDVADQRAMENANQEELIKQLKKELGHLKQLLQERAS